MNVYERGRCKLGATLDASLQPFELCFLARQIVSVLERRYGRNLAFKDIRRLLRHAMDFRDRFWEVMNLARCEIVESGQPRGSAVAIVLPYMGLCHEDYDAHIRALRHLWFGPTDLPPTNRASRSLVKFVFGEEDEHEEALYGTANHRVS
ncbi:hypothetical protein ISG10_31205, partial [Burkholderia pseudomallei]|nr:hypothetical protein [Burkholderia pseudomallei]